MSISITIPVYNSEKTIKNTLISIMQSSYTDFEILCVDDGSKDHSAQLLDQFAAENDNLLAIHSLNGGVSHARNTGIECAAGEYLAFVDSDDTVSANMYSEMIKFMKENQLDCVECGINKITLGRSHLEPVTETACVLDNKETILAEVIKPLLGRSKSQIVSVSGGSSVNKVYKKQIISDNSIRFNEGRTSAEDWQFIIEYYAKCTRVGFLPESYYSYIRSEAISLSNAYSEWYQVALENRQLFSKLFPELEWNGKHDVSQLLLVIEAVENVRIHFDGEQAEQKIKNLFTVAQRSGIYSRPIPMECDEKQKQIILALQNAINNNHFDEFKRITIKESHKNVLINKAKLRIKTSIKKAVVKCKFNEY